jgi:hypothetical protein
MVDAASFFGGLKIQQFLGMVRRAGSGYSL